MKLEEFKKGINTLIDEGNSLIDIAMMVTKAFVRGDISKDFYIATLHYLRIGTEKMDDIEENELRDKLYKALTEKPEVGGESGKEATAEKNNAELESESESAEADTDDDESESAEADRLFGLDKKRR